MKVRNWVVALALATGVCAADAPAMPEAQVLTDQASATIESSGSTPLQRKEAFRQLERAIKLKPDNAVAYYVLARYYAREGFVRGGHVSEDIYRPGSLDQAIEAIGQATRANPQYREAWAYAGYLRTHAHDYPGAEAAFAQAHAVNQESDWLDVNEAELLWHEHKLHEAAALLDRYLATSPSNRRALWQAHNLKLAVACALGDAAQARLAWAAFSQRFPKDPEAAEHYAYDLTYYLGDFEAGEAAGRAALELAQEPATRHTLALALYGKWAARIRHGQDDEAAADLLAEARSLYALSEVFEDAALAGDKLKGVEQALKDKGLDSVVPGLAKPDAKSAWRGFARSSGLLKTDWTDWTLLVAGIAVVTLVLWRVADARAARMPATVTPPPLPLPVPPADVTLRATFPSDLEREQVLERARFRFSGSGAEYFRIWIVNLLLTLATLGVYSAWAKVRKQKYFYRNTEFAGARFDYHGEPLAILKGRVVAVALFLAYRYLFDVTTATGLATGVLLAIALPWLIRNSLRFRLRNSSYRGLRFAFHGAVGPAYYVFLVGFIGSVLTGYLLAPFFHQRLKQYQHNNTAYGAASFSFRATAGEFYKTYFAGMGILIGSFVIAGIIMAIVGAATHLAGGDPKKGGSAVLLGVLTILTIYAGALLLVAPYLNSRLQNLVWNHTLLAGHEFLSTLSARRLLWIYVTNFIGVVATLGFFMPWAAVRLARYKAESFHYLGAGELPAIQARAEAEVSAAGQETADFFDFDIAF